MYKLRIPPRPRERQTAARRGYGYRWQQASKAFLALHPECGACLSRGLRESATVVDHVTPHKGCERLFWDEANWQGLCKRCHDRKTAAEDGGFGRSIRG